MRLGGIQMIEELQGTKETVHFQEGTIIKLHDNGEAESYPMHWHLPLEIIMAVENSYGIRCGKTLFQLREGDILLVQPGVLHECIAPEFGRRFFCQISLPAQLIPSKMDAAMRQILPSAMFVTPEADHDLHAQVRDLLYRAYQKDTTGSMLADFTIYLHILQIIHLVYGFFEKDNTPKASKQTDNLEVFSQIQHACTHITEHYAEDITLDSVSHQFGFSKYHFSRLFKAYIGETFYRYLNGIRMSTAQTMLTQPDTSVTDIAYSVGYSSMSSFIRMFKDFYGCTPSQYRHMMVPK